MIAAEALERVTPTQASQQSTRARGRRAPRPNTRYCDAKLPPTRSARVLRGAPESARRSAGACALRVCLVSPPDCASWTTGEGRGRRASSRRGLARPCDIQLRRSPKSPKSPALLGSCLLRKPPRRNRPALPSPVTLRSSGATRSGDAKPGSAEPGRSGATTADRLLTSTRRTRRHAE